MSVLVHGVEMPLSCYGCNFWIAKRNPKLSFCCAAFRDTEQLEEVEDEG